jgi:hypothetical protein
MGMRLKVNVNVKFRVFWDVAPCSHVAIEGCFRGVYCLHYFLFFLFFLWLYRPSWTLASLMILPQIFLSSAFFHHASTFNNFTSFKTLSSDVKFGSFLFLRAFRLQESYLFARLVFLHSDKMS